MDGRVGRQAANRLLTLALGADRPPAPELVCEHDRVHEALEEVALARGRSAPRELE